MVLQLKPNKISKRQICCFANCSLMNDKSSEVKCNCLFVTVCIRQIPIWQNFLMIIIQTSVTSYYYISISKNVFTDDFVRQPKKFHITRKTRKKTYNSKTNTFSQYVISNIMCIKNEYESTKLEAPSWTYLCGGRWMNA